MAAVGRNTVWILVFCHDDPLRIGRATDPNTTNTDDPRASLCSVFCRSACLQPEGGAMTQGVMGHGAPAFQVKPHSLLDDVYGICVGVLFAATGILLLQAAGLITGGVAGIALLAALL